MPELIKTEGVVFNYMKYGDNHLIANIFTRSQGRLSFFIRGNNKKKNKYKNLLLPLNIVHLEFLFYPQKELHYFKSLDLEFGNDFFMSQKKSATAFLLSDFFDKITARQMASTDFFTFILTIIKQLNQPAETSQYLFLQTLVSALHLMGLAPATSQKQTYFNLQNGQFSAIAPSDKHLTKEETQYFTQLLGNTHSMPPVEVPSALRLPLIEKLLFYYRYHLNIEKLTSYDTLKTMYLK